MKGKWRANRGTMDKKRGKTEEKKGKQGGQ